MTAPAAITVFTSTGRPLTKRFAQQPDNSIHKETLATLYTGKAERVDAPTATALAGVLDGLGSMQAIATGQPKAGQSVEITTRANRQQGKATRSLEDFEFPADSGWLLWDYDDKTMPLKVAQRIADLGGPLAALFHIWPEARNGAYVIRPSSSDGVTAPNAPTVTSDGLHGFFLVRDVSQSKAILEALEARAWNEGLAWIALGKAGAKMRRSIVDTAVGSPERLIFEAGPLLVAPVTRQPRRPIIKDAQHPLDTPALPQDLLTMATQAEGRARDEIDPKAKQIETGFIDTRARDLAQRTGQALPDATRAIRQMMRGATLADSHLLQMKSGQWVSVGDLLDNPRNHNLSMPDPIEGIEYGTDKATLKIQPRHSHPTEHPRLISHAHGGRTVYRFARYDAPQPPQGGQATQDAPQQRVTLPKGIELASRRKVDMLAALNNTTPEAALPLAVSVAHHLQTRAPLIYSPLDVIETIKANIPTGYITDAEFDALQGRVDWLQKMRRDDVTQRTAITPDSYARHEIKHVTSLDQVDVTNWQGVMLVKAPMGAGKTQSIGQPFIQSAKERGDTSMAIAHRTTLISELSQRLGLPDYRTLNSGDMAAAGGCAVCLPSTTRGDVVDALGTVDCLFIDEVAQDLKFVASANCCKSGTADNQGVYNRLLQLVRDAKAVIVADADLDARTVAFLELARPNECFTIVEMKATPTENQALMTGDTGKILDAINVELVADGKVWLACESKNTAAMFARNFKRLGHKVICITKATKENEEVIRFLKNPEDISREYDLVISSPIISSGLSIEHKGSQHFTLGAYVGAGMATSPEDAKQQLGRVRYLTRFVIGLDYSNLTGGQHIEAMRAGAEDAAAIERLDIKWTSFDDFCAGIKAQEKNAKADFAAGLWWLLEAAGWQLSRPKDPEDKEHHKAMRKMSKEAKEAKCQAILAAPYMDSHQAGLTGSMARNSDQETRHVAHTIRTALGKLDIDAADVTFWNDGRGRAAIERFEDLIGAEVDLPEDSGALSGRDFREARRHLYSVLFSGIDLMQPLTQAQNEIIIDRVMSRPAAYAAVEIVGPKYRSQYRAKDNHLTPVNRPRNAGAEVRDILSRCGLLVVRKRSRAVPLAYPISTKGYASGTEIAQKGEGDNRQVWWKLSPESMDYMTSILTRREVFNIDAALANLDRTHATPQPADGGKFMMKAALDLAADFRPAVPAIDGRPDILNEGQTDEGPTCAWPPFKIATALQTAWGDP